MGEIVNGDCRAWRRPPRLPCSDENRRRMQGQPSVRKTFADRAISSRNNPLSATGRGKGIRRIPGHRTARPANSAESDTRYCSAWVNQSPIARNRSLFQDRSARPPGPPPVARARPIGTDAGWTVPPGRNCKSSQPRRNGLRLQREWSGAATIPDFRGRAPSWRLRMQASRPKGLAVQAEIRGGITPFLLNTYRILRFSGPTPYSR